MSEPNRNSISTPYDSSFYAGQKGGSIQSATAILPIVIKWIQPESIVDVGCGIGQWLTVAERLGVTDVLGLDGAYVDQSQLAISREHFKPTDLSCPFDSDRRFDLAMSLEVAEHLPHAAARAFVKAIASMAPAVLFSAAPPGQGGTHHENEQWPSYWASLFAEQGMSCHDPLRPLIWQDSRIEAWYRQNILLFLRPTHPAAGIPTIQQSKTATPMSLVHPELYESQQQSLFKRIRAAEQPGIRVASRALAAAILRRLSGRKLQQAQHPDTHATPQP